MSLILPRKHVDNFLFLCCESQVERLLSATNPDPQEFDKAKKMLRVCIIKESFGYGPFYHLFGTL